MVCFRHIIIFDSEPGLGMTLGRTSLVTDRGADPLSKAALDCVIH
jgi:Xaa-Pro dipeptidase